MAAAQGNELFEANADLTGLAPHDHNGTPFASNRLTQLKAIGNSNCRWHFVQRAGARHIAHGAIDDDRTVGVD
jgi:hypothetical protein